MTKSANIYNIADKIVKICKNNNNCSQCELNKLECGEFDLDFTTCDIEILADRVQEVLDGKDHVQIQIINKIG